MPKKKSRKTQWQEVLNIRIEINEMNIKITTNNITQNFVLQINT